MSREVCGICWCPYDDITGDCACPPPSVQKSTLRQAAVAALEALDWHSRHGANWASIDEATEALRAALAEPVQETDLSRCPQCGGPADNGHDRSIPPSPYFCTKCVAEPATLDEAMAAPLSLAQAYENGWNAAKAEQGEPVAWRVMLPDGYQFVYDERMLRVIDEGIHATRQPLYAAPPQRKPLSLTDLQEALVLTNLIDRDAIEDPEEYDEGSTMAQIEALHRSIKERV